MCSLDYGYATNPVANYAQAIENKKFTIVLSDLVKCSPKSDKSNSRIYNDSYLIVDGTRSILRLDPRIDPYNPYREDDNSSIKKVSKSNSKNNVYNLILHNDKGLQNLVIRITLYRNSNNCYVQLITQNTKTEVYTFNGYITL